MKISKEYREKLEQVEISTKKSIKEKIDQLFNKNKAGSTLFSRRDRIILYFIIKGFRKKFDMNATIQKTKFDIENEIQSEFARQPMNENLIKLSQLSGINDFLIFYIAFAIIPDPNIFLDPELIARILSYLLLIGYEECIDEIESKDSFTFLYEDFTQLF